jgi:SAM-dependent methyltransferase
MLDLAKVAPQDFVIDLGSGDGRIVIAAAKRGARALGIEYNPDMVELSKANAAREGVSNRTTFVKADLFEADLSKATVITMFLLSELNLKLRSKLLELKPGTRLVSNTFDMGDWAADETATLEEECETYCTALLWIVPAKAEGEWHLRTGELALTQQFQMLNGTLTLNGNNTPIADAKMLGDQITLTAGSTVYTGRLRGNVIEGEAKAQGSSVHWSATRTAK